MTFATLISRIKAPDDTLGAWLMDSAALYAVARRAGINTTGLNYEAVYKLVRALPSPYTR